MSGPQNPGVPGVGVTILNNGTPVSPTNPFPITVETGGPQPFFVTQPIAAFGNPIAVEMFLNNNDGTLSNFPFQTHDGLSLLVQNGLNQNYGGTVFSPGDGSHIDTPEVGTLRVIITATDILNTLSFADELGNQLRIYPEDGSPSIAVIPANATGIYYMPVCGQQTVQGFAPGGTTWAYQIGSSPQVFKP